MTKELTDFIRAFAECAFCSTARIWLYGQNLCSAAKSLHNEGWRIVKFDETEEMALACPACAKEAAEKDSPVESPLAAPSPEASALFHKLWTQAVGSEGYNKQTWKELREALYKAGVDL